MKSFDTELKKYTDKVRLTASERDTLRSGIVSYIEYHPLSTRMEKGKQVESLPEESFAVLRFSRTAARLAVGLFVLTLVVIPFAAERSVPGEVLYFVKTGITEPVQAQFMSSPYEKIKFETKLVERRITEARTLASEGKLTDEVQTELSKNVKTHTQNVTNQIAELRTQDADGAAIAQIAFNSSLEVQTAVLDATKKDDASPIGALITTMTEASRDAALPSEEQIPSYENLLAHVEDQVTQARTLSETIKKSASPDAVRDIDRRFSDIDRLITESKAEHDAIVATSTDATISKKLVATLQLIQKLATFMTDMDVRKTVTLDALVPVVLSDEERLATAEDAMVTIPERIENVKEKLVSVTDVAIASKVSLGISQSETLSKKVQSALTARDANAADAALSEVKALLSDLENLEDPANSGTDAPQTDGSDSTSTEDGVGDMSTTSPVSSTDATTSAIRS